MLLQQSTFTFNILKVIYRNPYNDKEYFDIDLFVCTIYVSVYFNVMSVACNVTDAIILSYYYSINMDVNKGNSGKTFSLLPFQIKSQ